MSKSYHLKLLLIPYKPDLTIWCPECGSVVGTGVWLVGINIDGKEYGICCDPAPICCGKKIKVLNMFPSVDEANDFAEEIKKKIDSQGIDSGINLIELSDIQEVPVH